MRVPPDVTTREGGRPSIPGRASLNKRRMYWIARSSRATTMSARRSASAYVSTSPVLEPLATESLTPCGMAR